MKYGPISDEALAGALKYHSAEDIDIARMAEELIALRAKDEHNLAEIRRLDLALAEAKRHLDERIQWQAEAALNLQTFRALFDAAVLMREGHEGCVTEPACGACFRCDFDKAVDQAKLEVAAGVDEFIQESLGFWGRFAAKMMNERDKVQARLDAVHRLCRQWDWHSIAQESQPGTPLHAAAKVLAEMEE
jgi:hypothetical protein